MAGCHIKTVKVHLNKLTTFKNRDTGKFFSFSDFNEGLSLKDLSTIEDLPKKPTSNRSVPSLIKLEREKLKKETRVQAVPIWVLEVGVPAIVVSSQSKASKIAGCSRITVSKHCKSGTSFTSSSGKIFSFANKEKQN